MDPLELACEAVNLGHLSLRQAAVKFKVSSYSTLRRRIAKAKSQQKKSGLTDQNSLTQRETNMKLACEAVQKQEMSLRRASVEFRLNYSTLRRHLTTPNLKLSGGQQKFTEQEEQDMASFLVSCDKIGVPLVKRLFTNLVLSVGRAKGLSDEKNRFTVKWRLGFLKRFPEVAQLMNASKDHRRSKEWNIESRDEWITYLTQLNDAGHLSEPNGIWNLSAAEVVTGDIFEKISTAKGTDGAVYDGDEKQLITVFTSGNATGLILPLISFGGSRKTESGSGLDFDVSLAVYFRDEIIPRMTCETNYIFVADRFSHLHSVEFLKVCIHSGKNIKIVRFPAGFSDRLLLLDKCLSGPVEQQWGEHLQTAHPDLFLQPLCSNNLPAHLAALWPCLNIGATLKADFEKYGVFPFSPDAIMTVEKIVAISLPRALSAPDVYLPQKRKLLEALREMHIPEPGIRGLVNEAVRLAKAVAAGKTTSLPLTGLIGPKLKQAKKSS